LICYFEGEYNIEGVWRRTGIKKSLFSLAPDSLQLLKIWHLRRVVPSLKFCFLPEKILITETDRPQRHDKSGLHMCLTSGNLICPDAFSPIPAASFFYEDP
jgi:hypothetical protein